MVDGPEQAIAVANAIAPEHLQLMNADPEALVPLVRTRARCSAVATRPRRWATTSPGRATCCRRSARRGSPSALRVDDFLKQLHVVTVDEAALSRLAPHVAAIAEAEGLVHHAESVRLRGRR